MTRRKILPGFFLPLLLLTLAACTPAAKIPLPVLEYGQIESSGHQTLLIILRGIGGNHTDFEKYGLIDQVRAKNLPLDIIVPDAHFGYYQTETIEKRLKQDIVDPAKAKGYRHIWLAGFSMGGLGSLFYLREHPEDIDGIMLISPFLGWFSIRQEIKQAGGIRNWQPESSQVDDWQFIIWSFVHQYAKAPESYPSLYLGYGQDDWLTSNGPQFLAEVLDPQNVFTVPGGHDYPTFKKIWAEHLVRLERQLRNPR